MSESDGWEWEEGNEFSYSEDPDPESLTLAGGLPAGIACLVGLAILVYRRRTVGPVFRATTVNDKVMYALLAVVIVLGMWNTVAGSLLNLGIAGDHF